MRQNPGQRCRGSGCLARTERTIKGDWMFGAFLRVRAW